MAHVRGRDEHHAVTHEGVGGLAFDLRTELLQPKAQGFEKFLAGPELLVFVVFETCHPIEARKLLDDAVLVPLHHFG